MPYDDLLDGVESLIEEAPPEAREHLNFREADNYGTGMASKSLNGPATLSPLADGLPPDTAEVFAGFQKWHKAFGNAVNTAAGPAAMAAVGFPAAGLLGQGSAKEEEFGTLNLQMNDDSGLDNPEDTFGTTSKVNRLLNPDFSEDVDGVRGWDKLAVELGGGRQSAGFLQAVGNHLVQALPSLRQYAQISGDANANLKAVSMLAAQMEFADEWPTFNFEGGSAAIVLKEWHKLVTTGSGNADVAVDGITKIAKAAEWIQHPELLISPTVALSYMNLDESQATVGLRIAQWQERSIESLSEDDIASRLRAVESMHPSGLMEPLVDNVRKLMTRALGGPEEDLELWIERWRERGKPLALNNVGHVAGAPQGAPSTTQMKLAVETVARETGRVRDVPVTPEEINSIIREEFETTGTPLGGQMEEILTGRGVPTLESLHNIDQDTDFRRFRARSRTIRLNADPKQAVDSTAVTVEAASDGSYKVMSDDGASAFRNRAVGFLNHNGRQATVPVRPRASTDAKTEFTHSISEGQPGAYFDLDIVEIHPAFGEKPQLMISTQSSGGEQLRNQVVSGLRALGVASEAEALPPHLRTVRDEDGNLSEIAYQADVFTFDRVADLMDISTKVQGTPMGSLVNDDVALLQFYVNTDMDQPPGTVKQWETFVRDQHGRTTVSDTRKGLGSRTDQIPHFRLADQVEDGPGVMSVNAVERMDGELWSAGETVHLYVPVYGASQVPVTSHDPDDLAQFPQDQVVTATRKPNGNVVIGLPKGDDGKVETMLAKMSHEIFKNLGRSQISLGGKD